MCVCGVHCIQDFGSTFHVTKVGTRINYIIFIIVVMMKTLPLFVVNCNYNILMIWRDTTITNYTIHNNINSKVSSSHLFHTHTCTHTEADICRDLCLTSKSL